MWLSDLRIVLPDRVLEHGSIRIEDDIIVEVIEGSAPDGTPSMAGLTAIPGIVDLHGDMLERDIEPRPNARFPADIGLLELDKRLAASGITTAYAAISFSWRQNDLRSQENATLMIDTVYDNRDDLMVDFKIHARFEVTNPLTAPILSQLLTEGKIDLVSIMDHTPGQGQYGDIDRYVSFVQNWLGVDLDVFEPGLQNRLTETIKSKMQDQIAKPRDWGIVEEVLRLANEHHIPAASHDDDTAEKVAAQYDMGVRISEFPVTLEAAQAAKARGMWIVMGAPNAYRRKSTGNNLSAIDAIRAGMVDVLATDYYPAAPLHAAFQIAEDGLLPLHESIKLVTTNAAAAVHLSDRGRIANGQRADIVLVESGARHRVRGTIRSGMPIFWDAHMARLSRMRDLLQPAVMKPS